MYANLRYKDEVDMSFGIVGMAIALVACNCEDSLLSISIEPDEEHFQLSEDFFILNQTISAKAVWKESLKQYSLLNSIVFGNVMCRAYSVGKSPDKVVLKQMKDYLAEEGAANCSLEKDEIDNLYNKNLDYYRRFFTHPQVLSVAKQLADALRLHRRMSADEVFEYLNRLQN